MRIRSAPTLTRGRSDAVLITAILLARQRGFGLRRDAEGAVRDVDAHAHEALDAASVMTATGSGIAGLYACDQISGVPQAFAPGMWRQRGRMDRQVHGPTHLLHGQVFSPRAPTPGRSASGAAASAAGG